jgi:hypothetical protein
VPLSSEVAFANLGDNRQGTTYSRSWAKTRMQAAKKSPVHTPPIQHTLHAHYIHTQPYLPTYLSLSATIAIGIHIPSVHLTYLWVCRSSPRLLSSESRHNPTHTALAYTHIYSRSLPTIDLSSFCTFNHLDLSRCWLWRPASRRF